VPALNIPKVQNLSDLMNLYKVESDIGSGKPDPLLAFDSPAPNLLENDNDSDDFGDFETSALPDDALNQQTTDQKMDFPDLMTINTERSNQHQPAHEQAE